MILVGNRKPTPQELMADLSKVRYVLEGSVRRAGNSLRITAQLIEAATDAHLWADKYTGTLDDVFDLQEKLSRSIVEALKMTEASFDLAERLVEQALPPNRRTRRTPSSPIRSFTCG